MVGVAGLEPTTSATRTLRATNCATLRLVLYFDSIRTLTPGHPPPSFSQLPATNFQLPSSYSSA